MSMPLAKPCKSLWNSCAVLIHLVDSVGWFGWIIIMPNNSYNNNNIYLSVRLPQYHITARCQNVVRLIALFKHSFINYETIRPFMRTRSPYTVGTVNWYPIADTYSKMLFVFLVLRNSHFNQQTDRAHGHLNCAIAMPAVLHKKTQKLNQLTHTIRKWYKHASAHIHDNVIIFRIQQSRDSILICPSEF